MKKGFLLAIASLTLVACSSGGGGGASALTSAFTTLGNAIVNALPGSVSSNSLSMANADGDDIGMFTFPGDFNSVTWPDIHTNNFPLSRTGAQYLADLVSNNQSQMSARGKFMGGLMIACFLDLYALKGSDGKLLVGNNQSFTIQSSWAQSNCPGASMLNPQIFGQSITYDVTDISSGGVYDRKIYMPSSAPFNFDQYLYLKVNNGEVTFAHDERHTSPGYRSVNFAYYNPNGQEVRAQFVSSFPSLKNIYRLYSKASTNEFALLAHHELINTHNTWVVLTGKANNSNIATVAANYNFGTQKTDQQGCFNYSTNLLDGSGTSFGNCNGITGIITNGAINLSTGLSINDPQLSNSFSPSFTASSSIRSAPTGLP
jgi:hypothetical protein